MAAPESPDAEPGVVPYLVAMLLCDQIITEQGTNKKSLIGVFDSIRWPGRSVTLPVAIYYEAH